MSANRALHSLRQWKTACSHPWLLWPWRYLTPHWLHWSLTSGCGSFKKYLEALKSAFTAMCACSWDWPLHNYCHDLVAKQSKRNLNQFQVIILVNLQIQASYFGTALFSSLTFFNFPPLCVYFKDYIPLIFRTWH